MTMVNSYPERMNLSFSGCGFLCIYHAGVAAAIREYAPQLIQQKVAGASAGSIIACGLLTNVCLSQATSTILRVVSQARSHSLGPMSPNFNLLGLVREGMEKTLPSNAWELCNGRLLISLTRWKDMKNVVVSEYSNNQDLIDAIICSSFIPGYCGMVAPYYRGVQYIDGGFTDNQPAYDDHTITVSPFSGESDICPSDEDSASLFGMTFSNTSIRFTTRNLFRVTACLMPPSTEECRKMCLQGFEDALRFLTRNGMAPCIRCLTIQANVERASPNASPNERRRSSNPRVSGSSMPRNRSFNMLTSPMGRKRYDTCCESDTCGDSDTYSTDVAPLVPRVIIQELDNVAAAEEASYVSYILSFRIFRYTRVALGLTKLPFDMMLIFVKNLTVWMRAVTTPVWLAKKLQQIVDFVLQEIDNQRSNYTARFSCQLAITETEFDEMGQHSHDIHTKFELSREAKQELGLLREKDRRHKRRQARPQFQATSDDDDSLQKLIEYSHNHDAMYAFHYLDDDNKWKSCGVFDLSGQDKRHTCHSKHGSFQHSRDESRLEVIEESSKTPVEEIDSGLSVEEAPKSSSTTNRRDACCSPVRQLQGGHSMSRSSLRSSRRHTLHGSGSGGSTTGSLRKASATSSLALHPPPISSDSDPDTSERFFVPRRIRTASPEYDGEVEQSDN